MRQKKQEFIPASPSPLVIRLAQEATRIDLALNNKVHLEQNELDFLRKIPKDSGVVLISNHADETDPRLMLHLSQLCDRRFITMCNREAFDEVFGVAGWFLQRLGLFSVKRGAHDQAAKDYAIDVVKQARDVLVIFPEGEIYYLNEQVQPFHSGAIDICLRAIAEQRAKQANWKAYIVPMAIKYHYTRPIEHILTSRVKRLEKRLSLPHKDSELNERLRTIQEELLRKAGSKHGVDQKITDDQHLTQAIITTERAILRQVAEKHDEQVSTKTIRLIDESWRLGAELRENMDEDLRNSMRVQLEQDLAALNMVAHLSSWQPHYYKGVTRQDRLAEVLLKLERETYGIRRPKQLAPRNVFVKIAEPIDLVQFVVNYESDAHGTRRALTDDLHSQIQSLVDALISKQHEVPAQVES